MAGHNRLTEGHPLVKATVRLNLRGALGRLEQRAWLDHVPGGDPARFGYLSARPSNPTSQVR